MASENDESIWPAVFLVGFFILISYIPGCGDSGGDRYADDNYRPSIAEEREPPEPENPYNAGSGHSAGFEWAEENDVSSCSGNSQSFIEGCEEYLSQRDEAEYEYDPEYEPTYPDW